MSNYVKKTLYTLAILLCTISSAAEDFCVNGIFYTITSIDDKTVEVTKGTSGYKGKVIIPETVSYTGTEYVVKGIGQDAFSSCTLLSSVKMPPSITYIGNYAFSKCSILSNISISENVESIGEYAFQDCSALSEIILPQSLTTIGKYAFSGCSALSELHIPEGVTRIEDYTFSNCSALTELELPHSLVYIGSSVALGLKALESLVIYENIQEMASYALVGFEGHTYLYSCFPPKGLPNKLNIHCLKRYYNNYSLAGYSIIPDIPDIITQSITSQEETYKCELGEIKKLNVQTVPLGPTAPGLTFVTPNTNIIGLNNITGDFIGLADGEATVTVFSTDGGNAKTNIKVIVGTGVEAKSLKCDVNGDGKVTMEDANLVINAFLGK